MRALLALSAVLGGCAGLVSSPATDDGADGPADPQGVDGGADDPSPDAPTSEGCPARPRRLGTHPHAAAQPTELGRVLMDTEGWNGRLYFGYGDFEVNSGPIVLSSYDPVTETWEDHLSFDSEQVMRFRRIGDELWAPANDPRGAEPEYAAGTSAHAWRQVDIGISAHVFDVVERAPGDIYLVGADWASATSSAGAVWRSTTAGATWTRIFPEPPDLDFTEPWLYYVGTLNGKVYTGLASPSGGFHHDGAAWSWEGPDFGEFTKPVEFGGAMVFEGLGTLMAFDGTHGWTPNPGLVLYELPFTYPVSLFARGPFEVAEGRLIAVTADLRVMATTDLQTWTCLGEAPPDLASIGAVDGTVYFGASEATIYGFDRPSW